MKVKIEVIEKQLKDAAAKLVSEEEAAYFADLVLGTHLRKAPRMNPLEDAVADLKVWTEAGERKLRIEVDKESVLLLDFDGLAPAVKIKYIHDELEHRARKNGMAAVGFRNSAAIITLNPWSEGLARRDLIGVTMFNGGTRGVFGTLPLAYAIPTADKPIILDMAMTEIPFSRSRIPRRKGWLCPKVRRWTDAVFPPPTRPQPSGTTEWPISFPSAEDSRATVWSCWSRS